MANCFIFPLIAMGVFFSSLNKSVFASETISSADIADAVKTMVGGEKSKKKKSKYEKISFQEMDEEIVKKVSSKMFDIIEVSIQKENSIFQTMMGSLKSKSYSYFLKKIPDYGLANRTEEQNKKHFSRIWLEAINTIFEVASDEEEMQDEQEDVLAFSDEEESDSKDKELSNKVKMTLLNILLRKSDVVELPEKVQTLIENGADKNLHKEFSSSPQMQNQKQFPLYIILCEIKDNALRKRLLSVFSDDDLTYNSILPDSSYGNRLDNILQSVNPNRDFILNTLIEKEDFPTFSIVMDYLEKSTKFLVEVYSEKIAQIDEQIWCPILEKVLRKMMGVRRKAISYDEEGESVDNVAQFFKSKKFSSQMKLNGDARFSTNFQERLDKDFSKLFDRIAKKIDSTKSETQLDGSDLKKHVVEWAKWANFRNRIAKHLNRYALSASNEGKRSNVIKLIRYANIYDKSSISSEDEEVFLELHEFGGAEIIFVTRNKLKWTPLMYAMFQKQSEGIQLYLRQAPHEITRTDGVDNNILHLAFPLPDRLFRQENDIETENALDLVGANIGVEGAKEKTFEAIRAIVTEGSITIEDKLTALNQLSAANFTPVSLAAATGYVEVYEFLVRFLKANNAWNEDDHAHLGTRITELVLYGLENFKKSCEANGNLGEQEEERINSEIKKRQETISESCGNCIREIYHSESYKAQSILAAIRKPADEKMKEFYSEKGTRQRVEPYSESLRLAINEMLYPSPKIERIELPPEPRPAPEAYRPPPQPVVKKKKSVLEKIFGSSKKKSTENQIPARPPEPVRPPTPKPRIIEKRIPSVLEGMRGSTSAVKASYLIPVIIEITEYYLRDHASPTKMSFDAVYKGITGIDVKEFFQRSFNPTVEKKMQDTILKTMKKSGRHREDVKDSGGDASRFDNLSDGVYDNGEGSFSEEESNEASTSDDELDF
jgi:hypothetical protein